MATGYRDLSTLVMLTGWDATQLKNFELEDGTTYAQVASLLQTALGALNVELLGDDRWSGLVSYQDDPEVEYRVGASNGFERHTEYGRPDPKRGETEGHMLPLASHDRLLGWTWDYLRKARMSHITADIRDAIKDARDLWRKEMLTRVLKRGDDSGAYYGLGTSGYSPGFATAAASTSVDFVPPAFEGTTFTSAHEHYVGITGGAFTVAVFQDSFDELREHGHEPPFEFWIGPSDRTTVEGLTGFVKAPDALVNYGALQDTARVPAGSGFIGTIENFRVREIRGIPQYYGFGFKSYGPSSQRNPLRVRLGKGITQPRFVAMTDPNAGTGVNPLQNLMLFVEFGVGVYDRTNGTARYTNSATWADGTPT